MNKRKRTILQILIVSIAVVLLAHVWPLGYVRHHEVSACQGEETLRVALNKEHNMIQYIKFQQEHIDSISSKLYVEEYDAGALAEFRLYDENIRPIYSYVARCELLERDGRVEVPLNMEVEPEKNYFFEWMVLSEKEEQKPTILSVPLTTRDLAKQEENIALFCDGDPGNAYTYLVEFDYSRALTGLEIIIIYAVIIVSALIVYFLLYQLLSRNIFSNERVKQVIKKICTMLVTVAGLVVLYFSVIKSTFGTNALDKVVYLIGICCLLFLVINAIWLPAKEKPQGVQTKKMWVDWIQSACIAYAVLSACRYVNALGLKTQITNQNRITYCVVALLLTMPLLKKSLDFRYFWRRINWVTLVPWIVFIIPVIQNRYEKNWTWLLLLLTAFVLFKLEHEEMERFLHNFGNGIYISFFFTTLYALMHRPYNRWILYRYAGMFHTVAYTGMFLSVVVAVSLGRILMTVASDKKDRVFGLDAFVLATSTGYIFLSMTRTAILAIGVTAVFALILIICIYKPDIWSFLRRGIGVFLLCFFSFFMVFTVTRIVPAVINEPEYLEIEQLQGVGVSKGEKTDSYNYMSFDRYLSIFFGRLGGESAKNETDTSEILLASNQVFLPATITVQTGEEGKTDLSNGRFDIFRTYLKAIGWESHEDFAAIDPDTGIEYAHAHNAFLQISYLFGLFAGIMFLAVCVLSWITSIYYLVKNKQSKEAMLPSLMVTIFGITSMVEWTFNPCNPIGFAFLFIQTVLMQRAVEAKPKK